MPGWINPVAFGVNSRPYLGHTARYRIARGFLLPGDTVLDIGCGCGYGSHILASVSKNVIGMDIDEDALSLAYRDHHIEGKTKFIQVDLDDIDDLPDCDVAVCFETIEHIEDPSRLAHLMRRRARRLIVMSTPYRDTLSKWHKHKFFTRDQLLEMFTDDDWSLWEFFDQGPYTIGVFYRQ